MVTLANLFSKFQFQDHPAVHGPGSQHAKVGCGDKSVKARSEARESMLSTPRTVFAGPRFNCSIPALYSERNNAQLPDPEI